MFKEKLKLARINRGLSQDKLIFELIKSGLDISKSKYLRWEHGKQIPDIQEVTYLMQVLGVDFDYFLS